MELIHNCIDNNMVYSFEYSLILDGIKKYFEARLTSLNHESVLAIVRELDDKKPSECPSADSSNTGISSIKEIMGHAHE